MKTLIGLAATGLALAGCATHAPPLYSWGSYEDVIYASYLSPQDVPAEKQMEILEKDYQVARAANRRLPPGWHTHLGYLYYEVGKPEQARQELVTEKAEFPESGRFVDRLLTKLNPPEPVTQPTANVTTKASKGAKKTTTKTTMKSATKVTQ